MASPITVIKSHGIDTTGDYVVNSISSTGNVSAGNIKSDHLLYANGTPYAFTSNAAGTNTQVQFNDGNNFAGSANLTFDKITGTLTTNFFVGNGSQLTGLPASYTDTNANSAIDARVTKTFVDNLGINANTLNGHSDTYFATSTQGALADSAVQPGANISVFTNDSGYLVAANLSTYATESYVGNVIANLVNSAPAVLDTLGELANAIGNDASFVTTISNDLANKADTANLSTVALTGNYTDLNGLPTLFDGEYTSLANAPTLFNGEYSALANKPTLFSGSYVDLTNKPSLFDGEYASLANKPSLFSGSYVDLTNKPTLGTAAATDATAYATAAQGTLADTALQSADLVGYATETYVDGVVANIAPTDLSSYATQTYVGNAIANLVASAPAALDTLNELAIALGNDASYSTTITNQLANKLSTSDFTSTANTWISTQSSSNLAEGTNQYYTVARANSAIDARVTKSFVDNLAVVANIANIAYSVDGANVSGAVQYAAIANSVSASNVVGQVANALLAGTVYTNAQPNITSVGSLTSLSVSGTLSLSNIASLYIPGGTANYVLKTDGSGTLSWTALSAGGNANIGGSNTQLFFNDANSTTLGSSTNLTFNKTSNTLTTTNMVVSGTTNLGAVANITITGGNSNSYLKTDGSGTLSWVSLPTTSVTLDSFTGNGVRTDYDLTSTPTNANYTIVAVAGVMQPKTTYSVTGNTLSFSEAPPNLAPVEITTINSGVSIPASGGGTSGYTYQGVSANATLSVATRYIVNTSSANLTLTLPATANLGDEIGIIDGTGTASTHALTVYANGGNIMGDSGNLVISTNRAAFVLVYYNSSQGWLLTQL